VRVGAGTSLLPGDDQATPICRGHHRMFHNVGRHTFERTFEIDLLAIARQLWAETQSGTEMP
jgi:hypothetical protein